MLCRFRLIHGVMGPRINLTLSCVWDFWVLRWCLSPGDTGNMETNFGVWKWSWELEPKLTVVPPRARHEESLEDVDRYRVDADGRIVPLRTCKNANVPVTAEAIIVMMAALPVHTPISASSSISTASTTTMTG